MSTNISEALTAFSQTVEQRGGRITTLLRRNPHYQVLFNAALNESSCAETARRICELGKPELLNPFVVGFIAHEDVAAFERFYRELDRERIPEDLRGIWRQHVLQMSPKQPEKASVFMQLIDPDYQWEQPSETPPTSPEIGDDSIEVKGLNAFEQLHKLSKQYKGNLPMLLKAYRPEQIESLARAAEENALFYSNILEPRSPYFLGNLLFFLALSKNAQALRNVLDFSTRSFEERLAELIPAERAIRRAVQNRLLRIWRNCVEIADLLQYPLAEEPMLNVIEPYLPETEEQVPVPTINEIDRAIASVSELFSSTDGLKGEEISKEDWDLLCRALSHPDLAPVVFKKIEGKSMEMLNAHLASIPESMTLYCFHQCFATVLCENQALRPFRAYLSEFFSRPNPFSTGHRLYRPAYKILLFRSLCDRLQSEKENRLNFGMFAILLTAFSEYHRSLVKRSAEVGADVERKRPRPAQRGEPGPL
jgi:hypothetical protein